MKTPFPLLLLLFFSCDRSPIETFDLYQLWSTSKLELTGTLRGHRRGVWAVAFSTVDKVLASASGKRLPTSYYSVTPTRSLSTGDRTVRIWNLKDLSCVRTLQGHTASVLTVGFIRSGLQLLTTGADGLMKIWNLRDGEVCPSFHASDHMSMIVCAPLSPSVCSV